MSFSNRIFNVNGIDKEDLKNTLNLAFKQDGKNTKCQGWKFSKKHGLILLWIAEAKDMGFNVFPASLNADQCVPFIIEWLACKQALEVEMLDWDADCDHDGHNSLGWRIYCEDWGHVDGMYEAICAVKPAYIWYGK